MTVLVRSESIFLIDNIVADQKRRCRRRITQNNFVVVKRKLEVLISYVCTRGGGWKISTGGKKELKEI